MTDRCDHPCPNCGLPTRCRRNGDHIKTTCDKCNRKWPGFWFTSNDWGGHLPDGTYVDTREN